MITVLLSLVVVFLVLVLSELLWNNKILKGEPGRKFVHIAVGSFVAFWPFYLSFRTIQIISIAFFVVVLAARYLRIFQAVHVANRKTWGDLLFALGIGLAASLTKNEWIFTTAILSMSLADGLAGVIGTRYGKSNNYKIFGHNKSKIGTATFWLTTLLILLVANYFGHLDISLATFLWLPIAATAAENIGLYGLDNIFVPLLVVLCL